MTQPQITTQATPSTEDFAALLDETFRDSDRIEGSVVTGTIIAIDNDEAVVDVGLKAEGRVPLKEFSTPGHPAEVQVGDQVEVYVERFENRAGEALLSRDKARREESWNKLEQAFKENDKVQGMIFGRVKGGFAVDLGGAIAFLPAARSTFARCATSARCSTRTSRSRSSRWTGAAATSWCPAVPCSRSRGPSSATSCWPRSRKARC